jgi:hypothetical protein
MGLGSRDRRVIPAALADVIADEARAVTLLAKQMGAEIAIDPVQLLRRDIALQPPTHWSPNRYCQLVEAADCWIAVNLPREDDRDAVPAWLECDAEAEPEPEPEPEPWDTVVEHAKQRKAADLIERAILLEMPIAAVGDTPSSSKLPPTATGTPRKRLSDMTVVDGLGHCVAACWLRQGWR